MTLMVVLAFGAGLLVSLSRQINARLALATTPLMFSFWNHIVGFAALAAAGLAAAGLAVAGLAVAALTQDLLWPPGVTKAPWQAWIDGPIRVVFIAASSGLVARLGAVMTASMVIGGQMASGVVLDIAMGAPGSGLARACGVALILGAMALSLGRRA